MPGKSGIAPDHSSRSVPLLMPLKATSTTTSASTGPESSRRWTPIRCGLLRMTATVSTWGRPSWLGRKFKLTFTSVNQKLQ